jgi:hypothetical protein
MFSDIQQLQDLLVMSSLKAAGPAKGKAAKGIKPNSNKTVTKEADVASQDPNYPNDLLAYVLSCSTDDDDNTICTFIKPGDQVDLSSEF